MDTDTRRPGSSQADLYFPESLPLSCIVSRRTPERKLLTALINYIGVRGLPTAQLRLFGQVAYILRNYRTYLEALESGRSLNYLFSFLPAVCSA